MVVYVLLMVISSFSWSVSSNLIDGGQTQECTNIVNYWQGFELWVPWTHVECYWGEAWWSDWVTWLRQIGWHSVYLLWHTRLSVLTPKQACLANYERCRQVFFWKGLLTSYTVEDNKCVKCFGGKCCLHLQGDGIWISWLSKWLRGWGVSIM